MIFDNLRISRKLAVSFAAIALTIVAMGAVSVANLRALDKARQQIENGQQSVMALSDAKFYLARQENSFRGYLLSTDPYYIERANKHRANFKNS